jgi:nucleoid-associated protein YgaU
LGIFDFIKDAGEKLFSAETGHANAAPPAASAPAPAPDIAALNKTAGEAIASYIQKQGLGATDLSVTYDGATQTVTVSGQAADQATREKILLAAGNVQHVAKVDDQMTVPQAAPVAQFHAVVSGDNLWKIAEKYYGSGAKNGLIFEANRPMLGSPDKIYPGQVLRIPAAD